MDHSWRQHLGPPPPRKPPEQFQPAFPLVRRLRPRPPSRRLLDWRLRVSAGIALLLAIVALGSAG